MNKNDLVKINIVDLTNEGEGIGKADGFPLFVKDTCIGDEIICKVIKLKKNYGYGRLMEVVQPSPYRVEPVCSKARACGGCQIQEMKYSAQLEMKTKKVLNNLNRIGGFQAGRETEQGKEFTVFDCIGMDDPFHYRNKAQVPFGRNKEGDIVAGFYAGRTHTIVEMEDCALTFPEMGEIIRVVKGWMKECGIDPYDEVTRTGLIRHLLARKGFQTGQILLCFVINGNRLPKADVLFEKLMEKIQGIRTLCINVNRQNTNVILGEETRVLYGPGYIEDFIGEIKFQISPQSFYQVNPVQTKVLYEKALEFAELSGQETVWDLYCGIGTISLFLAQKAKQVYGVEIVPKAIVDAKNNAHINQIKNVGFFTGKAEEVLPEWYEKHKETAIDVIVTDPPRKGCDEKCLETMVKMQPRRIVYVSCDSATLARDLKYLKENGYRVQKVQPVDMFGMTGHVETVILLSKKDIHYAYLDYEVKDNEHLKLMKGSATYAEIKKWVLDTYGLKVSALYIAQVKDKLGFEKRECYNEGAEGHRVPHVTPEKEQAIIEAFKHFKMI